MKRTIQALLIPPVAVCRYGCASCCAAPIGVFWIAGIVSMIYAFFGGPTGQDGISLGTLALGAILWAVASLWAINAIRGMNDETCRDAKSHGTCKVFHSAAKLDESDPMEEVKKFR